MKYLFLLLSFILISCGSDYQDSETKTGRVFTPPISTDDMHKITYSVFRDGDNAVNLNIIFLNDNEQEEALTLFSTTEWNYSFYVFRDYQRDIKLWFPLFHRDYDHLIIYVDDEVYVDSQASINVPFSVSVDWEDLFQ